MPVEISLNGQSRGILGPNFAQLSLDDVEARVTWLGDKHNGLIVDFCSDTKKAMLSKEDIKRQQGVVLYDEHYNNTIFGNEKEVVVFEILEIREV